MGRFPELVHVFEDETGFRRCFEVAVSVKVAKQTEQIRAEGRASGRMAQSHLRRPPGEQQLREADQPLRSRRRESEKGERSVREAVEAVKAVTGTCTGRRLASAAGKDEARGDRKTTKWREEVIEETNMKKMMFAVRIVPRRRARRASKGGLLSPRVTARRLRTWG